MPDLSVSTYMNLAWPDTLTYPLFIHFRALSLHCGAIFFFMVFCCLRDLLDHGAVQNWTRFEHNTYAIHGETVLCIRKELKNSAT